MFQTWTETYGLSESDFMRSPIDRVAEAVPKRRRRESVTQRSAGQPPLRKSARLNQPLLGRSREPQRAASDSRWLRRHDASRPAGGDHPPTILLYENDRINGHR
jgi:hypothetical protein